MFGIARSWVYAAANLALFFFAPLSWPDLLTVIALGLVSVLWFEAIKLTRRLSSGSGTLAV